VINRDICFSVSPILEEDWLMRFLSEIQDGLLLNQFMLG
jgi:hypothetical protein